MVCVHSGGGGGGGSRVIPLHYKIKQLLTIFLLKRDGSRS